MQKHTVTLLVSLSGIYKHNLFIVVLCSTENKVLVMGGMAIDTNPRDMFVEFDVEENKWKKLPGMPTARYATFAFLVGDKLYVVGEI